MYRVACEVIRHQTWREPWASLIRMGLHQMWRKLDGDLYDPDDGERFGVDAFDRLSQGQQVYLAVRVGRCLLLENEEEIELHQCVEATAAALFSAIEEYLLFEVDDPMLDSEDWRRSILACHAASFGQAWDEPGDLLPLPSSVDKDEWCELLDLMRESFFWDYDFEDEESLSAGPGEGQEFMLEVMGVASDYFVWVPRVPSEQQAQYYGRQLNQLARPGQDPKFSNDDVPPGAVEGGRFAAQTNTGQTIELTWHHSNDGEGKPIDVNWLRTPDGLDVHRLESGHYRVVVTGETLAASHPESL